MSKWGSVYNVCFLPLHIFSFFIHIQVKLQKAAHLIIYNCCQSFFYEAAEWCRDVMYSRGEAITPGVPFDLLAFVRLLHSWETCNERKWHAVIRFVYDTRRTYISRKLTHTHARTHMHTVYYIMLYMCRFLAAIQACRIGVVSLSVSAACV